MQVRLSSLGLRRGAVLAAALAIARPDPSLAVQEPPPSSVRAAIQGEVERQTRAMSEAFARGDLAAVARFYADDAQIYGAGDLPIRGRAAIDRFWQRIRHPRSWALDLIEVGGSKDEPYHLVRSTLIEQAGMHADTSLTTCLLVWRRQADGRLLIHLDVYGQLPKQAT